MRKLILMLLAAATMLPCAALSITNTAGRLASKIDGDVEITELTLAGTMDARDFQFIRDSLLQLTTLDLREVTINSYNKGTVFGAATDYAANAIPRTALFGTRLTSVLLPRTLEVVDYAAFAGCDQLTSITLPSTVTTIGDYAFAGSGLTTVTLPSTVTSMGKGVFARCTALTSATIEAAPVGNFAFLGDTMLATVELGEEVNAIGIGAFNGCTALQAPTIAVGSAINRIGDEAFIASGLTSFNAYALSLTGGIGSWAFAQTPLPGIALPSGLNQMGEGVFAHDYNLQTVTMPVTGLINKKPGVGDTMQPLRLKDWDASDRQTTISDGVNIKLPTSLVNIPDYTFASDTMLELYGLLPYGVTTVGAYAFYDNSQLTDTMTLPSTVTYLGDWAMAGMTGMVTLRTDNSSVPSLGDSVWAGVKQNVVPLITPSSESTALYKVADQWMDFFYTQEDDWMLGDVNCDGVIDITDVTALIDHVLGSDVSPFSEKAADLNGDGDIDITDVTALIDMILGGSQSKSPRRIRQMMRNRYASTTDALTVEAFTMRAGETRTVDVLLTNEQAYTALQCEIVLPQGITLQGISAADRDSRHQFAYVRHTDDESVVTVMGFNLGLEVFEGNQGAVMRLTLAADDNVEGNAMLSIENVLLATQRSGARLSNDVLAEVSFTANNGNTGVEELSTTGDKQVASVRYFNTAGQESGEPFSGINIVVTTYTDGTTSTTKVLR